MPQKSIFSCSNDAGNLNSELNWFWLQNLLLNGITVPVCYWWTNASLLEGKCCDMNNWCWPCHQCWSWVWAWGVLRWLVSSLVGWWPSCDRSWPRIEREGRRGWPGKRIDPLNQGKSLEGPSDAGFQEGLSENVWLEKVSLDFQSLSLDKLMANNNHWKQSWLKLE